MFDSFIHDIAKQMKTSRAYLKRNATFWVIFLVWLILSLIYFFCFIVYRVKVLKWFDQLGTGFGVSFSASFLEDLTVFICLSLIIIILTTRTLWSYGFGDKIYAIVNSKTANGNDKIIAFLNTSVSKLLSYHKNIDATFTVTNFDPDECAYKLFIEMEYNIRNICRDQDYYKKDSSFKVYKADAKVQGESGHVTLLTRKNITTGVLESILKDEFELKDDFEILLDYSVERDSGIDLNLKYNTWSKTGERFDLKDVSKWCYIKAERYIETVKIMINNYFHSGIKFDIYLFQERNSQNSNNGLYLLHSNSISSSDEYTFKEGLFPEDDIRIFFYKQS